MTKPLSQFYDLVLSELPGCAMALADLHLVRVARDFCERTRSWRADLDPVASVAGATNYDIAAPELQSELVAVHKLSVNGLLLWDDLWFDQDATTDAAPKYSGNPIPFSLSDDLLTLTLIGDETPAASQADGITGRCSMKPKQGATALPDLLWLVHSDAIRAGVLADLMLMAGKPWSAGPQGLMYRGDYHAAIQHAAMNAQRGNTRARLRTRNWG